MNKRNLSGVPPRFEHVLIYFQQKGLPDKEARDFFLYYEAKNWCNSRGESYLRWKGIAHKWIVGVFVMQPSLYNRRLN